MTETLKVASIGATFLVVILGISIIPAVVNAAASPSYHLVKINFYNATISGFGNVGNSGNMTAGNKTSLLSLQLPRVHLMQAMKDIKTGNTKGAIIQLNMTNQLIQPRQYLSSSPSSVVGNWKFNVVIHRTQISGTDTFNPDGTFQTTLNGGLGFSGTYQFQGNILTTCTLNVGCISFTISNLTDNSFTATDLTGSTYNFFRA